MDKKTGSLIDSLYRCLQERFEIRHESESFEVEVLFEGTDLESKVCSRKMQKKLREVEAFLTQLKNNNMFSDSYCYVDWCSGKGILGAAIAYLLHAKTYLVDKDAKNLNGFGEIKERLVLEGIIKYINTDVIENPSLGIRGPFVYVGLHCCGNAPDYIINYSINEEKPEGIFIVPCCYGKIDQNAFPMDGSFGLRAIPLVKFREICKIADYFGKDEAKLAYARKAMYIIDALRVRVLEERGYSVKIAEFLPRGVTPKNHMIIGQKI